MTNPFEELGEEKEQVMVKKTTEEEAVAAFYVLFDYLIAAHLVSKMGSGIPERPIKEGETVIGRLSEVEHAWFEYIGALAITIHKDHPFLIDGTVNYLGRAANAMRDLFWAIAGLNHREMWGVEDTGIRGMDSRDLCKTKSQSPMPPFFRDMLKKIGIDIPED